MASDGSQPLFGPAATSIAAAVAPPPRAATGVWDGPAPKGWRSPAGTPAASAPPAFDAAKEPRNVLLGNGVRLPLLGVAAADAAGVECVPRRNALTISSAARGADARLRHPQGRGARRLPARGARLRGGGGRGAQG